MDPTIMDSTPMTFCDGVYGHSKRGSRNDPGETNIGN